jgi:mRNA-degrading endonuclease HigB of HigAB toxin-antitoxin module
VIQNIEKHFLELTAFLQKHSDFYQRELLDYYPHTFEEPLHSYAMLLKDKSTQKLLALENNYHLPEAHELTTKIEKLSALQKVSLNDATFDQSLERKMTHKKRHELKQLVPLSKRFQWQHLLDFGGGSGQSAMALLSDNESDAISVDLDEAVQAAGVEKIVNYLPQFKDRIQFKKVLVKSPSDLTPFTQKDGLVLGLHACGDLSSTIIQSFLEGESNTLINFGCCYHKGHQYNQSKLAQANPIEFSFHALNLAAKSYKWADPERIKRRHAVKKFRYALEMFVFDKTGEKLTSTGNAHYKNYYGKFSDYALKYLPPHITPSENELDAYFQLQETQDKLAYYINTESLRILFGRLIEIYLVLDRALYLMQNNIEVELLEVFDRKLSPRNIALIGIKDSPA